MQISLSNVGDTTLLETDPIVAEVFDYVKSKTKPNGKPMSAKDIFNDLRTSSFRGATFVNVDGALHLLRKQHVIERTSTAENGMWRILPVEQSRHLERKDKVGLETEIKPLLPVHDASAKWEGSSDLEPLPIVQEPIAPEPRYRNKNVRVQVLKIIADLAPEMVNVQFIADELQMDPNNISACISGLKAQGLLQWEQRPVADSNRVYFYYTLAEGTNVNNGAPSPSTPASTQVTPREGGKPVRRNDTTIDADMVSLLMRGVFERAKKGDASATDWTIIAKKMGIED